MSILSWNCQGAGNPETGRRLREMRRKFFPDFLFLMETKQKKKNVTRLQDSLGYDNCFMVEPLGLSGGLAVFWKNCYKVEVLSANDRIIDLKVKIGSMMFFLTCVYGDPVKALRHLVWERLSGIGIGRNEAWVVLGDFNELMTKTEKMGGPLRNESSFWDFRNMAGNCKLAEIRSSGNCLSWAGWRDKIWIQCRLDRSFGNDEWFQLFPRAHMEYLDMWASDHRPILITFALEESVNAKGRFCFDKRWLSKPGIVDVVKKGWCGGQQDMEISLAERIGRCRSELSRWKRSSNTNSEMRMVKLKETLEKEVSKMYPDPNVMQRTKNELAMSYKEEEIFWKHCSREQWLDSGDRNTRYFHNCVKSRKVKNRILMLVDEKGHEQFSEGSKGQIAVDYFRELFSSSKPQDFDSLLEGFEARITPSMNEALTAPVLETEIKQAVFNIKGSRAPGADGLTSDFYQHFWSIVGPSITAEIQNFFSSFSFPIEWNYTQLCLIPKVKNPSRMSEMRPISLCSVHYKIISKIMCERLKKILPLIISDTQGAFVSGRVITDNIIIAHELIHALRTNDAVSKEFMAIKTDMSKAYDRVEWCFLERLMEKMGFDHRWIKWISYCIRSVTYTVLLNENSHGYIKPERGLRQGDPLSSFLFILCAEGLVNVLNKAEASGRLNGIKFVDSGPSIHHLLFADDSLLLCKASANEGSEIMRCLKLYGEASGQVINNSKSSIIFGSKVEEVIKPMVKRILGIEKEGGEGSYLGLPECFNGSKRKLLNFIQEKLQSRLHGWFAKSLSQGGKEVLLKSIALALPVYAMSCFQLPQDLCKKLTSVMTEFWWSSGNDRNKIPWVAWKKLCRKKEDGGLGFHDIFRFNQALVCKQAWRLLDQPQSLLARILKSRYFKNKSFLDCGVGTRPSYAWRSIIHGRELLKRGLRKSIGNGQNTWVWIEKWIPDDSPRPPISLQRNRDVMLRVSDLLDRNMGQWDEERVRHLFIQKDADYILSLRVSTDLHDTYVWSFSKNGLYNSQSGYKLLEALPENQEFPVTPLPPIEKKLWSQLWKVQTMPKIRHFMWKALAGALAVSDRLQSRGIHIGLTCKICGKETETICHVLFHCPVAKQSWDLSNIPAPRMGFSKNSVFLNLFHLLNHAGRRNSLANNTQDFPWLLWHIWKSRNLFVFEGKSYDANSIVVKAREDAETWMAANKSDATATNKSFFTASHTHHTWRCPMFSFGKCNIGCSWIKQVMNCGAAWILRDHSGKPLFHSRRSYSKIATGFEADLLSLLWAVESLSNLRQNKIIFEISSQKVVEAVRYPHRYPLFRHLISDIRRFLAVFEFSVVVIAPNECNRVAKEIATSVTRDHRYQSYIAREGPLWLQEIITEESKLLV